MKEKKILVIQPLPGIGDLLWFDAHMQTLAERASNKQVSLMTKKRSLATEVFKDSPYVEEILWVDPKDSINLFSLVKDLRKHAFTEAWILHTSWKYVLAAYLACIPNIYGYGKGWTKFLLTGKKLTSQELKEHPIERATTLLRKNGILLKKNPKISVSDALKESIKKKFSKIKHPWIVLGIGGSEPKKKWPIASFIELAQWLKSQKASVFILSGKNEVIEAHSLVHKVKDTHAVTDLSLSEVLAFLDLCDGFIGNDTGTLNMAAALNKPAIGLFLASPALKYRPTLYAVIPDKDGKIFPQKAIHMIEDKKII
jgi:heptosyltransferase-2